MSDKVQLGLRIDAELYEEFKEHVKQRRGRWQGVAGDELENAIRHYLHFGAEKPLPDMLAEFNDRLQRIEGAVGTAEADGGADTLEAESHTHAPNTDPTVPDEKPPANSATEKKVAYLAARVNESVGGSDNEWNQVPKPTLIEIVKQEYGFRSDTAKRYVDELVSHFDLTQHPHADNVYAKPREYERLVDEQKAALTEELDHNE